MRATGAFKKCHNYTVSVVRCQWSPRTDISFLLLLLLLLVCPSCIRQFCFLLLYSSCFCFFPPLPSPPPVCLLRFHRHRGVIARFDTVTPGPAIELIDLTLRAGTFERPFPRARLDRGGSLERSRELSTPSASNPRRFACLRDITSVAAYEVNKV